MTRRSPKSTKKPPLKRRKKRPNKPPPICASPSERLPACIEPPGGMVADFFADNWKILLSAGLEFARILLKRS